MPLQFPLAAPTLSRIVPHLLVDGWTLGEIEMLLDWLENQR